MVKKCKMACFAMCLVLLMLFRFAGSYLLLYSVVFLFFVGLVQSVVVHSFNHVMYCGLFVFGWVA